MWQDLQNRFLIFASKVSLQRQAFLAPLHATQAQIL
jgi:hypothetical protein